MAFSFRLAMFLAACCISGYGMFGAGAAVSAPDYREIRWEELIPKSWHPEKALEGLDLTELSDSDPRAEKAYKEFMAEWVRAPANEKLQGQRVKIPGYIAPLDWEDSTQLKEFLLVPYFGACIHLPPPPANQIIYVKMGKPLKGIRSMDAVWVYGTLSLEKNDSGSMGTSGYSMQVDKVERYSQ